MIFKEIITTILERKWFIFWLTILGAAILFDLMVIQVPKYHSNSRILVVQEQVAGQDIYSISKSAQYLTRILKESIYSDSFFEKLPQSSYQLEESDFPTNIEKRRKEWQKSVKINIVKDLGVMEINVFYPEKDKAEQINWAITDTLVKNHRVYHGGNENIELKILDYPLVNQNKVIFDLWLKTVFGGLFGFLVALFWVLRKKIDREYREGM